MSLPRYPKYKASGVDWLGEVLPHVPDSWIEHDKTEVGDETLFNRHFCVFKPPRQLAEIDAELKIVTDRIVTMIGNLSK